MPSAHIVFYSLLSLIAFTGNSLLARGALAQTDIDAASFTLIRILSAAVALLLIVLAKKDYLKRDGSFAGSWPASIALVIYAAGFSFSYVELNAGLGTLLLYLAVQTSMIISALIKGERFNKWQVLGLGIAILGLFGFLSPDLQPPSVLSAVLMLAAGAGWGIYSLLGQKSQQPLINTTGNFLRALPLTIIVSLAYWQLNGSMTLDHQGVIIAIFSGGITSALGYIIWYKLLPHIQAATAATMQLSVPVLTALSAIILLSEPMTLSFVITSSMILGGIALFIIKRGR